MVLFSLLVASCSMKEIVAANCSVWGSLHRQHMDVSLWCPSSSSTSTIYGHCLTFALAILLTLHFGST